MWSYHNYNDCELGGDRASAMRAQIAGRWNGRRADDGGPLLFATEGGVRLVGVERRTGVVQPPDRQRADQAVMLADAVARSERTAGVGLFTQYTVYADPDYDCGLLEPDGAMRPGVRRLGERLTQTSRNRMIRAPICTSSPWCRRASRTRRPLT